MVICKRIVIISVTLMLIFNSAKAQNIYTSPYSVYGLGTLNDMSSSLNRGMAMTGIGVRDPFNLNLTNPASYGSVSYPFTTIFDLGVYLESNKYKTLSASVSKTNGGISSISYMFMVSPRWTSVLGLSPFSSMAYKVKTTRDLGALSDVDYYYEGSGNISRFTFGNSVNITKHLSLGANLSFLFGSLVKTERVESGDFPDIIYDNKIYSNKVDFNAGLQYNFTIAKDKALVVGLIADDGLVLNGTSTGSLYTSDGDTLTTVDNGSTTFKIPPSAGLGLSWQTKKSVVASDIRFKQWSKADFNDQEYHFNDVWRLSVGYSYNGNPEAESWLGLASIQTGIYYENNYMDIQGSSFSNWGLSAGISMPIFDRKSSLGVSYSYDKTGTTSNGLVLQHAQKFMFNLVFRDLWGQRKKYN